MALNEVEKCLEDIKLKGKTCLIDGATEDQIIIFEGKIGVKLPYLYHKWLQITDGGECFLPAGIQFYGVAHKPFISMDDDDRPSEDYTVIGALASGDPVLCQRGSDKISIYNREGGKIEKDEVYSDFVEFLKDLENILGLGG